jgi:hypothetical protein
MRVTTLKNESSTVDQIVLNADGSFGGELASQLGSKLDSTAYQPGLVLIDSDSFSAVSSVSVDNCFTSTYENYRIIFSSTSSASMRLRLRASSSDDSTSNYDDAGRNEGSATGGIADVGATSWRLQDAAATSQNHFALDILKPQIAAPTMMLAQMVASTPSANIYAYWVNGQHRSSTAYDGFSVILGGAGNFTGNIRVYGYRN